MSRGRATFPRVTEELRVAIREAGGLLTADELATRWGVTKQAVSALARRHDDFPTPVLTVGRVRLYSGNEADTWRSRHRKD